MKIPRDIDSLAKYAFVAWVIGLTIFLIVLGLLGWVAYHFINRYW